MSGHVQDLLSAYLDGELSPPERAMVEAHLAACDACAARLEDFATLDTTLRALPIEPPAGYFEAFPGRLRERLRGRATPAASWRVPVWGWAAAAALILAILTPLTLRQARLSPVPETAVARAPAASGAGAPGRPAQAADDEAPAPRASEALHSAPYVGGGRGSLGESAREPRVVPEAQPATAPEPDGREDPLRKTGAGGEATFAAPPAEARREAEVLRAAVSQRQAEERPAGLAASSKGELGPGASPQAPRASVTSAQRPAGANTSREDAPADLAAAPQAARPEAPAPARLAEAERDAAESEHKDKDKAITESEGGAAGRASVAGARGRLGGSGSVRTQDEAAGDEFAALRARGTPGAATLDQARTLRDDWRSFAARNPAGPRGDEARLQVIEAGYRAWRLGRDARDLAVLARDAHTYLERADAAHTERVRAILAETERE